MSRARGNIEAVIGFCDAVSKAPIFSFCQLSLSAAWYVIVHSRSMNLIVICFYYLSLPLVLVKVLEDTLTQIDASMLDYNQ